MSINPAFLAAGEIGLASTPGNALQTVLNTNILTGNLNDWYDTGPYSTMLVTLIGGATITAGAVTFEQTNDNTLTAGRPLPYRDAETAAGAAVTAVAVTSGFYKQYIVPLSARYVRIRISTAFTGATPGVRAVCQMVRTLFTGDMNAAVTATLVANSTVGVQYVANATGAASRSHLICGASTNPTIIKAAAGRIVGYRITNTTASWRYVKLHNQATAPTAGTGVVETIAIPPNSTTPPLAMDGGIGFATGIAYTTVTGAADADATAVSAGDLIIDFYFA